MKYLFFTEATEVMMLQEFICMYALRCAAPYQFPFVNAYIHLNHKHMIKKLEKNNNIILIFILHTYKNASLYHLPHNRNTSLDEYILLPITIQNHTFPWCNNTKV